NRVDGGVRVQNTTISNGRSAAYDRSSHHLDALPKASTFLDVRGRVNDRNWLSVLAKQSKKLQPQLPSIKVGNADHESVAAPRAACNIIFVDANASPRQ